MTESDFGDDVYNDGPLDDDATQLDVADTLTGDDLSADPLDTGYSPPDYRPVATRYGTTALEEFEGESLDQRLAEEEPDITDGADDEVEPRTGRLIAPDEGQLPDEESDAVAEDVGIDGGAATAEEAAMHVIGEDTQDDRAGDGGY